MVVAEDACKRAAIAKAMRGHKLRRGLTPHARLHVVQKSAAGRSEDGRGGEGEGGAMRNYYTIRGMKRGCCWESPDLEARRAPNSTLNYLKAVRFHRRLKFGYG